MLSTRVPETSIGLVSVDLVDSSRSSASGFLALGAPIWFVLGQL